MVLFLYKFGNQRKEKSHYRSKEEIPYQKETEEISIISGCFGSQKVNYHLLDNLSEEIPYISSDKSPQSIARVVFEHWLVSLKFSLHQWRTVLSKVDNST